MKDAAAILGIGICSLDAELLTPYGLLAEGIDATTLPAQLRRRASQATKMAITAARRACLDAKTEARNLPSVFASVGGEIQITDTLCLALPDPEGYISPTQFHNSVHNTAAGYWSILNACHAPTTAIAASRETVAMAFMEAWCMLQTGAQKVLVVCYDETWPEYLAPPMGSPPFASAFVLASTADERPTRGWLSRPEQTTSAPTELKDLGRLVDRMPITVCISLLQAITCGQSGPISLSTGCPAWHINLTSQNDHG